VKLRRGPVTEKRAGPACEHRRGPSPVERNSWLPDGIDGLVNAMQPAPTNTPLDCGGPKPGVDELTVRDHTVLACSDRRDLVVDSIRFVIHPHHLPTGWSISKSHSDREIDHRHGKGDGGEEIRAEGAQTCQITLDRRAKRRLVISDLCLKTQRPPEPTLNHVP
jgi:hypothetical protein